MFCGLQWFFVHFSLYYLDLLLGFSHSKFQVFNNTEIGSELVGFYNDLIPYHMLCAFQGKLADHFLAQLIILLSQLLAFFFGLFSTLFLFNSFLFYFSDLLPQFNEISILQDYLGHCFGEGGGV